MASLIQLNQFTASIFDLEYKSKDLSLHVICNETKKGKHYKKPAHFRCSIRHLFVQNRLPWREPQHRKYLHSLLSRPTLAPIHNRSAVTHDGTGKSCVQWIVETINLVLKYRILYHRTRAKLCDHVSTRIGSLNRKIHENYERFVLTEETYVIYKHKSKANWGYFLYNVNPRFSPPFK